MRADWQQTAKTVLVMWPLRSVSAKRNFSMVVMEKSASLGARFSPCLNSPALLASGHRCVLTQLVSMVGDGLIIGSHRANADHHWGTFRVAGQLERGRAIDNGRHSNDRAGWNVRQAVDLEDVDSHCRTTDRHGKHRRQTDAEHRRCARGKSPTRDVFADKLHMLCPRQCRNCVRGHRCHRHCVGDSGIGSPHGPSLVPARSSRHGEPGERGQLQAKAGSHGHLVRFGWIGPVHLGPLLDNEAGCGLQDECATDVQQVEGRVGAPGYFFWEVLG